MKSQLTPLYLSLQTGLRINGSLHPNGDSVTACITGSKTFTCTVTEPGFENCKPRLVVNGNTRSTYFDKIAHNKFLFLVTNISAADDNGNVECMCDCYSVGDETAVLIVLSKDCIANPPFYPERAIQCTEKDTFCNK